MTIPILRQGVLFGGLALLMATTRYHHFGDALHLPDASLAIFFLAGMLFSGAVALPLLLVEAGIIDYLAMTIGGVSDWCFSPAYWFLVPTYACLWFGGRLTANHDEARLAPLPFVATTFGLAVSFAFFISNSSFYALSGRFTDLSLWEYGTRVAQYYPPYALNAAAYVTVALLTRALWRRACGALPSQSESPTHE